MSHDIEPELFSPLPRSTRRRAGFERMVFLKFFIAPHILIGLGLLASLIYDMFHQLFGFTIEAPDSVVFYGSSSFQSSLLTTMFWNGILSFFVWHVFIVPRRQRQLVRYGTPVVGLITGRHIAGEGKSITYPVEYEYTADSGTLFTGEMRVRKEDWASAYMYVPVTILYDPKDPRRSVIYAYAPYASRCDSCP